MQATRPILFGYTVCSEVRSLHNEEYDIRNKNGIYGTLTAIFCVDSFYTQGPSETHLLRFLFPLLLFLIILTSLFGAAAVRDIEQRNKRLFAAAAAAGTNELANKHGQCRLCCAVGDDGQSNEMVPQNWSEREKTTSASYSFLFFSTTIHRVS